MRDRTDRPPLRPTRREALALGIGALVATSIPLGLARGRSRLVRRRLPLMGTVADLAVVTDGSQREERRAHDALDAAFARLEDVERRMTRHVRTSEVGRANDEARRRWTEVSAETAAVLAAARRFAEATGGAFDPCYGSAILAWDVEHRAEPLPEAEARRWSGRHLWAALDLRPTGAGASVRFAEPAARLDLGGIAKGYGVDRAVEALRRHGVERALVNVGGDLFALGDAGDGRPWTVGVRSPDDPEGIVATLEVRDEALATSGDYVRGFTHRGRRYHHLLDPRTGSPCVGRHSLTVAASDCMAADAAATALYGMDGARAARALAAVAPSARIAHEIQARDRGRTT